MADTRLFKITYDNGSVKYGPRRVLGPVIGAMKDGWYKRPVKVEAIVVRPGEWDDVTSEFIKEDE